MEKIKKEKYLKLIFIFVIVFLALTVGLCYREISNIKKEKEDITKKLTSLQSERKELIRDYWRLADLFNQATIESEHKQEIAELKEKYEAEMEYYAEDLNPREVVERFLKADIAGKRFDEETTIEKYSTENFILETDLQMVIKKYEIIDEYPSMIKEQYFVKVRYFCKEGISSGFIEGARNIETGEKISIEEMGNGPGLVSFDCDYFYNPSTDSSIIEYDFETQTETITFELIKDKELWKLNSPSVCPRISEETLNKLLEGK
ncbi:hypothetical protein KAU51_00805 [Candidatus Parcubacteria bacterium]|nr:hypothetical protein [Candidatus Parcubacteria bacterium]